jgi:hypothetical protein
VYEALMELYEDLPLDMPQDSCFGDGTPIPDDILALIRGTMAQQEVALAFLWKPGDLRAIDNMLSAHGRSS